jgi:hypothetical protein
MAFAARYEDTVRTGTLFAAIAGFLASALAVFIITDDFIGSGQIQIISLSAIIGGTASMAAAWRWLVPGHDGFGMWRAVGAGAVSAIASSVFMWLIAFVAFLSEMASDPLSIIEMIRRALMLSFYFAIIGNILVGWVTIPLGIAAACVVTAWAQKRIETP